MVIKCNKLKKIAIEIQFPNKVSERGGSEHMTPHCFSHLKSNDLQQRGKKLSPTTSLSSPFIYSCKSSRKSYFPLTRMPRFSTGSHKNRKVVAKSREVITIFRNEKSIKIDSLLSHSN